MTCVRNRLLIAATLCGAGLACAEAAQDVPAALPAAAFQPLAACPLNPFVPLDPQHLERRLQSRCRADDDGLHLGGRAALVRSGRQTEARVTQALAWNIAPLLTAQVRLALAAGLGGAGGAAQFSTWAEFAGGLWWQPVRQWALNLRFGGRFDDASTVEQRLSMTSAWRPTGEHVVYSRWRSMGAQVEQDIGLRWWLKPTRLSVDLVLPLSTEESGGASVQLSWRGLTL